MPDNPSTEKSSHAARNHPESVKQKKTKKRGVGGLAAVLAALALLGGGAGLGLGGGFGLGNDAPGEGQSGADNAQIVVSEPSSEKSGPAVSTPAVPSAIPEAPEEDTRQDRHIVISEDSILYEGEELDLAQLEDILLGEYQDGMTVYLQDDHAIKSTYDDVAALLLKLGIEAQEEASGD